MSLFRGTARFCTVSPNIVSSGIFHCLFLIFLLHLASFVDVYSVTKTTLSHRQSISILPAGSNASDYRGDTLRFHPPTPKSPSPSHLFATSRGTNTSYKGFLSVFSILSTGLLDTQPSKIERWQTPTSGGGAN